MSKIIDISNSVISIGTDNGGIKEIQTSDINFVPHIGDEVELFETETKIIVSKVAQKTEGGVPPGGININLTNSQAAVVQPTYTATGVKTVNKVVYFLLAIFLGGLGAHKFYSGKMVAGIIYLVFSWTFIPLFISFIEGIIALTKPADNNGNIII